MRFELEALSARPEDMTQAQFADYVLRQLRGIADTLAGTAEGENEVATKAPPRPREGMLRYADGTAWNPAGTGKGPVVHDGSNWRTIYSTPAGLLAALLTVDGAGSLLDADFLDGQSSAYYLNAGNLNAGTLLAARMPALTGDVTTTVGTVATTIGANKVTLSMLAQMATGNVLGRNTAGTGDVELLPFDEAATASTLVKRNSSGYINSVYFNASNGDAATAASHYIFMQSSDGYYRRKTLANVKTEIVTNAAVTAVLGGGTASSSTLVTNLNADLLDGYNTSQAASVSTVAVRDAAADLYANVFQAAAGSASNPAFSFGVDGNTGMYRSAAEELAFATQGTARAWINNNGLGAGLAPTSRNNCSLQTVNGIGFPATPVASSDVNVLDEYEEGTFTPTITAASGAYTTVSASGEYTKIGNRVLWFVKVTITTNGTAGTYTICSGFPFTFGQDNTGYGRETAALGWMLQSAGNATGSSMNFLKWDNTYPTDGNNGRTLQMNGHFRV